MYVSNYFNIVNLLNGNYILSHTYLGSIDILEGIYAKYLIKCRVQKIPVDESNIPKDILDKLISKGYLVNNLEIDKTKFLKVANKLSNIKTKIKSYTIIPSYECNFRCGYCFELKTIEKNNNIIMSKETIDIMFKRINEELKDGFKISITLFGGEPFLPKNKDIINYILDKSKNKNININAISNGYYLDYYKDILISNKINNIQITLDGDKPIHDKRRVLKGDVGTFDKIFENITNILKNENSSSISIRINVDENNLNSLPNLLQLFSEKNFLSNKKFSFYTKCIHTCYTSSKIKFYDSDITKNIKIFDNDMKNMDSNISYRRMLNDVTRILNEKSLGFFRTSSCGAINGMLVLDPFGNIYSCYEEANTPSNIVGKINYKTKKFDLNNLYNKWINRSIQNIEQCSNCSYSLICGGGCPKHAKVYNGTIYSPNCEDFKKIYSDSFRKVFLNNEY